MKRTLDFRFSKRNILLLTLIAVLTAWSIFGVITSLTIKAQENPGDIPLSGDPERAGITLIGDASYERFSGPDRVTRVVRDRGQTAYRVAIHSLDDRAKAAKLGTIIEDYGSSVIVSAGKKLNLTKMGLDGAPLETTVNLPGRSFEPILDRPAETLRSAGGISGKNYYVVQFAGGIKDEWMESLRSVGVEFLQYLPHNAYYIYTGAEGVQKTLEHSRVRWLGNITPGSKLSPVLSEQLSAVKNNAKPGDGISPLEMKSGDTAVFDIAIFARADADALAGTILNSYAVSVRHVMHLPNNYFNVVRAELSLDKVMEVANIPDVIRIDACGTPSAEDEKSNLIVAGNYTSPTAIGTPGYDPLTQFGVNGNRVTVSVVDDGIGIPGDGGFYITSANTVDGPMHSATPGASGHGHLNATIIAGTMPYGTIPTDGYNYGLGVAPNAHLINIPFLSLAYLGTEADLYNDSVATAGPNGVLATISNNSWGFGLNSNVYDSYTAQFDGYVRDASTAATINPISLVFSAGNQGTGGLTRPKVAKNIISVASSENIRPTLNPIANNIGDIASSSSRGLANDGRVKPDIAAPGLAITGGRSGSNALFGNIDAFHRWSEGTSHAAPHIAGAAALFTEFWKKSRVVAPKPSVVKAAIILTGQEMAGVGATSPIPNGAEGWGRANMKYMLNTGVPMRYANENRVMTEVGENYFNGGQVAVTDKPVRVTLVWTDPPAAAEPALINNLDLTVTVGGPGGNVYKGNVFSGGLSATGGSADTLNNVENVWLPAGTPAGTSLLIKVTATGINGDGVLTNPDLTDQHFGLVIYNITGPYKWPSGIPGDYDGDGKADVSLWRPLTGIWYVFRSNTGVISQSTFGVEGDIPVPGDYNDDGTGDAAVWRPSNGAWYVQQSGGGVTIQAFGSTGDLPVQGDYDADGKTDIAVWRPSTGVWYLNGSIAGFSATAFGVSSDKPVQGDYDGDGRTDIAVWRPSTGTWYIQGSSAGLRIENFGTNGDRPVPGDYDGDGVYDIAVWRPSTGTWYLQQSTAGFAATNWGVNGDIPVQTDYDGDGRFDLAVFRPSSGTWYMLNSTAGFNAVNFGLNGDIPIPSAYTPQ